MSSILLRWVGWVHRHAGLVLAVTALVTVACAYYAYERFRINSDLNSLIVQEAEWRTHFDRFEAAFPDVLKTAMVVVHGDSFSEVERVAKAIEARVRQDPMFRAVHAPQNDGFLRDHALLYLDLDALDDMADRLAEAQPVLTAVAEDESLREILKLLADSFENDEAVSGRDRIVNLLNASADDFLAGGDGRVRWADEFFEGEGAYTRLVIMKGQITEGTTRPSAELLAQLNAHIEAVGVPTDVRVLVTGEIALTHEEIDAALSGVEIAGWLSIAFLVVIMFLGVRSVKIVIATVLMLVTGVIMTAAWAMFAVGEFNTLSLVFIVMFFGLGVDFALHFSLRYQEAVNTDASVGSNLHTAVNSVGRAIAICTVTTAIGFLSFWPTDYRGLGDLGVISAGGMLVAALLTFTLLPALYAKLGYIRHHQIDLPTGDRLVRWLTGHRRTVVLVLVALSVGAGAIASRAYFDYSVLAMRDESAPSMLGLRLLQEEGVSNDYALYVVHDADTSWVDAVEALASVDYVQLPSDLVPKDQEDKAFVLEDLQQLLWSAMEPQRRMVPPDAAELEALLAQTSQTLTTYGDADAASLSQKLLAIAPDAQSWQAAVIAGAVQELEWLRRALAVGEIGFDDLPDALRTRVQSSDGRYLSVVFPSGNVSSTAVLTQFVAEVRGVLPQATGRPVIEWGVGGIVLSAFVQALVTAVAAIFIILSIVFRSPKDALLIMLPLTLAALFTLALGVAFDQPINMASVLVIPLIFGLGVDNGIHVFDRYRRAGDVSKLLHSSTPRAVVLSTLTTVCAFSSLMLSPHAGTASIGVLLTMAVGLLLVFTVFLLPVLLHKP